MKHARFLWVVPLLAAIASMATAEDAAQPSKPVKATFLITGLHCPPCTKTVESSLRGAKGIKSVKVDWSTKNAYVEFDESILTTQALTQRIAGTAHMMGGGMRYGGWLALKIPSWSDGTAAAAQTALKELKGVVKVSPYPAQKSIGIQFAAGTDLTSQSVIDTLRNAGIDASHL